MNNFGHSEAMNVIFFSKCSKFYVYFENAIKLEETFDSFENSCISICCVGFCQLWKQYMWCAFKVLKNGNKIWDPTKRHHTKHNFFHINGT